MNHHIALVPDTPRLTLADCVPVAAAVSTQIAEHFAPAWHAHALVAAFPDRKSIPLGYWPVFVGSEGQGGGGVHLDKDRQPYALVDFTADWSVTVSHECLEMLADPQGSRLHAAASIDPGQKAHVRYLVEVCDPPEAFSYDLGGVKVSDFILPAYYGTGAGRYSFAGNCPRPLSVPRSGYISWVQSDGVWKQAVNFDAHGLQVKTLGRFDASFPSLRSWVDSLEVEA